MRLTLCEAPTRETRPETPVTTSPTLFDKFFNVPFQPINTEDAGDGAYGLLVLIREDLNV